VRATPLPAAVHKFPAGGSVQHGASSQFFFQH